MTYLATRREHAGAERDRSTDNTQFVVPVGEDKGREQMIYQRAAANETKKERGRTQRRVNGTGC